MKKDYLNNIAWEYWKRKVPTSVKYFFYQNVKLELGNVQDDQFPGSPSLEALAFHGCEFANQIYFEKSPKLKTVFISKCKGKLCLKGLELDDLVLGSQQDFSCFSLA